MIEGIDVSNHQGVIDWGKVAAAGKSFAFIKASQGDYHTDAYFAHNRAAAKAAGLLVSAYHFFDPRRDAKKQAIYFCDVVGAIPAGELQPVLDFESRGNINGLTGDAVGKDACIHAAVVWLTEVRNRTGRQPIIYTYPSFWKDDLGDTHRFSGNAQNGDPGWPLWLAAYSHPPEHYLPLGGWTAASFVQYADHGRCAGVGEGHADCDLDRFNGDLAHLRRFAGLL